MSTRHTCTACRTHFISDFGREIAGVNVIGFTRQINYLGILVLCFDKVALSVIVCNKAVGHKRALQHCLNITDLKAVNEGKLFKLKNSFFSQKVSRVDKIFDCKAVSRNKATVFIYIFIVCGIVVALLFAFEVFTCRRMLNK